MDPDQDLPQEQSDLGPQCLSMMASNSLVDDKNMHFVIMHFKG